VGSFYTLFGPAGEKKAQKKADEDISDQTPMSKSATYEQGGIES